VVEHQFVDAVEETRGAELHPYPVDQCGIHDSGPAESSIRQGEGNSRDDIVGHLVPGHDAERIRLVLAVDGHAEDPVVGQ